MFYSFPAWSQCQLPYRLKDDSLRPTVGDHHLSSWNLSKFASKPTNLELEARPETVPRLGWCAATDSHFWSSSEQGPWTSRSGKFDELLKYGKQWRTNGNINNAFRCYFNLSILLKLFFQVAQKKLPATDWVVSCDLISIMWVMLFVHTSILLTKQNIYPIPPPFQ